MEGSRLSICRLCRRLRGEWRAGMADTPLDWLKFFAGGLAGAVAVAIGLYQYVATSTQTAQKPFLEKQTDLCFHASETVARLATTTVPEDWKKQWDEFWMLYWGPL